MHAAVIIIAIIIAVFNCVAKEETVTVKDSSILAKLAFPDAQKYEIVKNTNQKPAKTNYLSIISIASASPTGGAMNTSKNAVGGTSIAALANSAQNLPVFNNDTLIKNSTVKTAKAKTEDNKAKERKEPFKYFVKDGDTITSIAYNFSVDPATILVENDLYADDIIKPGMELSILPVPGISKEVESGDTLEQIAANADADLDQIIKFNKLAKADSIKEGQILIIPDGKREIKERPIPTVEEQETLIASYNESNDTYQTPNIYQTPVVRPQAYVGNHFPWGWCTWYVAERRGDVSWMGNAREWLWNAQAQGRATGRIPAVGAILVTNESWWGHVAYVEAVNGDSVTISEMNYVGFGIASTRTISNSNGVILGYIY